MRNAIIWLLVFQNLKKFKVKSPKVNTRKKPNYKTLNGHARTNSGQNFECIQKRNNSITEIWRINSHAIVKNGVLTRFFDGLCTIDC